MSVEVVQSRIAEIQARLAGLAPVRPPVTAAPAAAGAPAALPASEFSAQLESALRGASATAGVPAAAAAAGSSEDKGAAAVAAARTQLGVPYLWGGTTPKGFDCSGLVQWAYAQQGVTLPRTSGEQARAGTAVKPADARPGDLVAFDNSSSRAGVDHIGIYLGDGKWIAAPRTGDVVKVQDVDLSRAVTIRRIVPAPTAAGPAAAPVAALAAAGAPAAAGLPAWADGLPAAARPHVASILSAAKETGVDARLIAAVAWTGSGFAPAARSGAGARGLMQLMPATARSLGVDPDVPAQSVLGGARYLAQQLKAQGGRVDLALAAYNAGPGAVKSYGGIPPYAETRAYVTKVLDRYTSLGGTA